MSTEKIKETFFDTMEEIASQIKKNVNLININEIVYLIDLIIKIRNTGKTIFVYGAGRSGFIGRCFAQRLMHLGIKSCFISDAVTYQYTNEDLLILISGSGETTTPVSIAQKAREIGGTITLFSTNTTSKIARVSDLIIKVEGKSKDVAKTQKSLAPYTSLFDISTLSILDSVCGTLMNILEISEEFIDKRHATVE